MAQKKVKTGVQLGKAAQREALDEMEAWWDAEVGEFPADLDSTLGLFLKSLPVEIVWDALRRAAQDDALQDSEDVLERVKQNMAQVRAPPLQKVTDPAEFGLKVQIERLLEWCSARSASQEGLSRRSA
ncbi:hypothetical protein [Hyalangium versicolor]|uniref:hypothetical protein n=1 Tax=Hyalangium versicolor TaxID=2861190 RepID=UPI001CCD961F|nr:hypothetical protein [Hyalangium versicolor]